MPPRYLPRICVRLAKVISIATWMTWSLTNEIYLSAHNLDNMAYTSSHLDSYQGDTKMKIMLLSNPPWLATGYGKQIKLLYPRLLAAGHQVAITPISGHTGGILEVEGLSVYPTFGDPVGQNMVAANARHFGADFILSLTDVYIQTPETYGGLPWAAWFPADHDTMPPHVAENLRKSFFPIAMSRFGHKQAEDNGIEAAYIPHAVDLDVFQPESKIEARRFFGWNEEAFIVGMVAANKGLRKAFPEHLEAFKFFQNNYTDAALYIHASAGRRGSALELDLDAAAHFLGLRDVIFPDQYRYLLGYSEAEMRHVYNAMDVHMVVSMGEGFGVPQLEAQACGTPVICGNWTAMPELCFNGWKVSNFKRSWSSQNAYQFLPDSISTAGKLEEAYRSIKDGRKWKRGWMEKIEEYDINTVFKKYWLPALEQIEGKLKAPRPVPGLEMIR